MLRRRKETENCHSRLPFNLAQCSNSDHHPVLFPPLFSFSFFKDTELCKAVDRPNIFIDPYFLLHKNPFSEKTNLLIAFFLSSFPSGLSIPLSKHISWLTVISPIPFPPSCVHHFNEGFESSLSRWLIKLWFVIGVYSSVCGEK